MRTITAAVSAVEQLDAERVRVTATGSTLEGDELTASWWEWLRSAPRVGDLVELGLRIGPSPATRPGVTREQLRARAAICGEPFDALTGRS